MPDSRWTATTCDGATSSSSSWTSATCRPTPIGTIRPAGGRRPRAVEIIQLARKKLGLPGSVGGKSIEYQALQDAADWRLLKETMNLLALLTPVIQELFVGRGPSSASGRHGGGASRAVVQPALISGDVAIDETSWSTCTSSSSRLWRALLTSHSSLRGPKSGRLRASIGRSSGFSECRRSSAIRRDQGRQRKRMIEISNRLGTVGGAAVAAAHPEVNSLRERNRSAACSLRSSVEATGKFDLVYEAANGRFVVIEAKGGRLLNPAHGGDQGQEGPRRNHGPRTYEVQGTQNLRRRDHQANVQQRSLRGDRRRARHHASDNKLDYYLVRPSGRRGRPLAVRWSSVGVLPGDRRRRHVY